MTTTYGQLVLFGDSLFQGSVEQHDGFSFHAALQTHCHRRLDVVNRGLAGYNTSNALRILPEIFKPPAEGSPKMVYLFVLLGANDACLPRDDEPQHVPLDKYREYLSKIITHANIVAHNPKIFLVTPPPLDEIRMDELDRAAGYPGAQRKAKISALYSETVRQIAAARASSGVRLIDLYKGLMDLAVSKTPGFDPSKGLLLGDPECGQRGYLAKLLSDGLHMSGESYRLLFDLVKPLVGKGLEDSDHSGFVFPDWRDAPWMEEDR